MQTGETRRSERVHYRGAVELRAREGLFDTTAVAAQAVDLGAGGMRVSAQIQMPVGAPVTCRVELDGREASLPGRVAWLAHGDGDGGNGIGICFDPLGSHERELLQQTVERSRASYRAVELRFAGVEPPIRARARARTDGIRLSAVLPILARGTELSFRLDDEGPQFTGRISEAALREEQGERRLEVDVDVLGHEGVRFRRRARYGYAIEIEAAEHRESIAMPITYDDAQATDASPQRRSSPALRIAALLLAASSGGAVGWGVAQSSGSSAAEPGHSAEAERSRRSDLAAPRAPVLAKRAPSPTEATASPEPPLVQQAAAAAPPSIAPDEHAAIEAPPVQLDLRVDGDVTSVRLPFDGSLDQMQARLWAAPYALAIDMPRGRTKLADGVHRLQRGSAGMLRIQRRDDGTESLRLTLATPLARYAVTAQDGTLELKLVRQPAIAPSP
jgi:PilZ domain